MKKNENLSWDAKFPGLRKLFKIMKLTTFLIMISTISVFASNSYSQSKTLNLNMDKVTVREILTKIEDQSEFHFMYSGNIVDVGRVVSINVQNAKINEVLQQIFKGTDVNYTLKDRFIVLTPAVEKDFSVQQKKSISGKVTDSSGISLPGVSVVVKGTTTGVITDWDGKYTLSSVPESAVLKFSFVGMKPKEFAVGNQTTLDVTMEEETFGLEEVVAIGFGLSQKKETLTGAVSSINSQDIKRSSASTASGALVGKIAGLNTRQLTGEPGQSTTISIRNMGNPLYVVDGMQSDATQFNNLDFNDIESIAVMKDASAAIYGMRAANGVIVVTTKRGSKNTKNSVSINSYYGMQSLSKYAEPANALTYIKNSIQSETLKGGSRTISQEDWEKWQAGTETGYTGFDWADYIWRTAPQYYANINSSGGSDKLNYYFSVGHLHQAATIRNFDGFYRTNFQMNIDANVTDRLKVGVSMNGRLQEVKNPASPESNIYWIPRWSMYRNLPTKGPYANDNPNYPQYVSTYAMTNFSIYNNDQLGYYLDTDRVVQLSGNLEYKIWDNLKLKALFGYFLNYNKYDKYEYAYSLYSYDPANDVYIEKKAKPSGNHYRSLSHKETLTSNIQLAYNKQFGEHKIDAVIGFETMKNDNPVFTVNDVPVSNEIGLINFNTINRANDYDQVNAYARMGGLGRVNYDYANKYLFEFSARYDGSWKFPQNHRFGFFPSASVGWRMSKEAFWQESKLANAISDLKVRASYGAVGDDNISGYSTFGYLSGYSYNTGGGVIDGKYIVGSQNRGLPVTTLSWMKAKTMDIGIDIAFLNNRLTGQFDFFRRLRTGLPASRNDSPMPNEVGFSLPQENLNSDLHKGFDLTIQLRDKVKDFSYSVGANLTYSRYSTWEQYKPRYGNSWEYYRNSSYHRIANKDWGYQAIGQFQSLEEIATYPVDIDGQGNTSMRPGDIIYKDVNKDGIINDMDMRPIGFAEGTVPSLNFGLNFSFQWKGFDLAFDFNGGAVGTYTRNWEAMRPFHDGGNNPQFYMDDTWHLADMWDANSEYIPGKYPILIAGNNNHTNYSLHSDFWTINTKYIKLRNLEFGYTLPKTILSKISLSDVRFYVSGTNLFTLTNTLKTDPETTNNAGLDYPTMRVMNFGLNVKF